jgi:hypothetical protein
MIERTGDYQEEVLSDLLDLQAELRGESRIEPDREPALSRDVVSIEESAGGDAVTVTSSGLEVSVAPSGAAVADRVAALNDRLARLESSLANVAERIDTVEAQPPAPQPVAKETWRSFLDLQRIVADRLDRR